MEIVLHIGAHRTASTALEQALSLNAGRLRRGGIAVWKPKRLRRMPGFRTAPALHVAGDAAGRAAWAAARDGLAAELASSGMARVLITEENILGGMAQNLKRRALYPDAHARLAAYAALLPEAPRRVGLGVRAYAPFWLSSYLYVQRGPKPLAPFEDLAPALARPARRWRDVVSDLRAVFPAAELCLWRIEDAGPRMLETACALVDVVPEGMVRQEGPVNAGLKPGHIPLVAALKAAEPGIGVPEIEARLAAVPPTDWRGFSPAEEAALSEMYEEETADFAAGLHGIRMLAAPATA